MKTIGLIFGSTDSEHDISVESAASVFKNFPKDKYNCLPIYIQKDGSWITGNFTNDNFTNKDFPKESELIFKFKDAGVGLYEEKTMTPLEIDGALLILHGPVGEGGMIQGMLEMANIPFTGSKMTSSAVCMDKDITHKICEQAGINMAPYQLIGSYEDIDHDLLTYPCVVKPSREGSSFGISYVENVTELKEAVKVALHYDERVLIEAYINGQELSVAILKTKKHHIVSHPVQATRFKPIADFEEKYVSDVQENLFDPPYSKETLASVKQQASFIFDLLDCAHISRADFFVTEDETIYFNEINTIPGFTSVSLYPMLIEKEGMEYRDLIEALIEDLQD